MKNIIRRNDGRWQYRKMTNGARMYVYAKTQKELIKKIKSTNAKEKPIILKINKTIDLINEWYIKYKVGISSHKTYEYAINKYFQTDLFKKDISKLTYIELENFIQNIEYPRAKAYCYYIIKGTFEYAHKCEYIKNNIAALLTKPRNTSKKGISFNLQEQRLILTNLEKSNMKYEILVYLLTGCRRVEGMNIKLTDIDFEHNKLYINGTKTESSKRYIPISTKLATILKENLSTMFKNKENYYSNTFQAYLKMLNIKNKKLHDLRHTFSTNLHYLGVQDKERQYYLGHSSIVVTNDIYTHLDPSITKQDILNLYKDLYPEF